MAYETRNVVLDWLIALALDYRFQMISIPLFLIHWSWRLPKPKKGAGNKSVVVTGCDSGMGHRLAKRFDELGMHVFAGCLNPSGQGARSLKECCSSRLHILPMDITNDDQVKEAVAYVKANIPHGEKGLYCLINNAGVLSYTAFDLMTQEMCEEVVGVNLLGTIRVTKYFLPLIAAASGRIVTITSILARLPCPRVAVYAATKHALNGFFSSLRYELADIGVHVATVEPGDFSTTTDIMQWTQSRIEDMWQQLSPEEKKAKRHLYEQTKKKIQKTKCSPEQQEKNYKVFLEDIEDAMLAEEPCWRYVSAPAMARLSLWFFRMLPEQFTYKFMAKAVQ
ncbi:dehydrogenase/reductase SDR family member 9-like isoform X2 [Stegodyphus dumicola]|nr:dehydrogenase/reductase SDR family member 9-like isoform X2 [Stegodyphus dumicola]